VHPKLIVVLVVKALHGCFFGRAVHPFDLSADPRMFNLGQPVIYVAFVASVSEDVLERAGIDVSVLELHAVVGQDRVDPIWHS